MEPSNLIYFTALSIMLTLLPGPDILFVTAQSISNGRKEGIATSLGLSSGLVVHTLAAALGISTVLHHSSVAFQLLKYAGAVYLLYLAFQSLKESQSTLAPHSVEKEKFFSLYKRGILMNLLNPKVSLFFLSFLPQFVSPQAGQIPMQMMLLGIIFIIQAFIIFAAVSICAGFVGKKLSGNKRINKYVPFAKAGIFAILGVRLALLEKI
ncbi:LysE family translocator [Paenactinomyces guangxiensis]|uniref:LysE family translocator n=1 Tax=Paenactinomyces guangxiensis TaxID=1490290 RepID=A0A7W1WQS8_9BACL|nr:LysE family translocator [Paenactinomyces guangxiensis]MBA4494364.1 LysE family translocator [Paenactinomyces guangxiensis]MBH8591581.1 LysE family translocator [Paenactinomyces guangxiensis]